MKFKADDIVMAAPHVRSDVFVITGTDLSRPKNQYNGVSLVSGKTYRLSEGYLASERIGVADPNWNKTEVSDGDGASDQPNSNNLS